jgi:hypothetical protein
MYVTPSPLKGDLEKLIMPVVDPRVGNSCLPRALPLVRWAGNYQTMLIESVMPPALVFTLVVAPSLALMNLWMTSSYVGMRDEDKTFRDMFQGSDVITCYLDAVEWCLQKIREFTVGGFHAHARDVRRSSCSCRRWTRPTARRPTSGIGAGRACHQSALQTGGVLRRDGGRGGKAAPHF